MLTLAGVSCSARPFVISGIALAMPPLPVLVPTPAPVRRNHSSSVRFCAFRAGAAPNVTYWLEPLSDERVTHGLGRASTVTEADAGRRVALAVDRGDDVEVVGAVVDVEVEIARRRHERPRR